MAAATIRPRSPPKWTTDSGRANPGVWKIAVVGAASGGRPAMNIAIFSGELSGDLIGGALANELKRLAPDVTLWGLGSASMRDAGVELMADSAEWGAISITEVVSKIPKLFFVIRPRVKAELKARKPDVVVLIDFGAANIRAARWCKALGLKVVYYFPPGAWRRTGPVGGDLVALTDLIATPFEWSAEQLREAGANAVCVGHPLLERVRTTMSRAEFASHFGMDPDRPMIGLLPGSRKHEVEHIMPTLLLAARLIYDKTPEAQFVVGVAPSVSPELMAKYLTGDKELLDRLGDIWHDFAQEAESVVQRQVARTANVLAPNRGRMMVTPSGVLVPEEDFRQEMEARRHAEHLRARAGESPPPTVLAKGVTYEVMAHSDVLLTCSGTATLEASLFATPMVILYRGSRIMEFEYKLRGFDKRVRHIGLPNILADERIVPELIQNAATPEAIASHALTLLNDLEARHKMKQALKGVAAMLGAPGASERTAKLVLDLANR